MRPAGIVASRIIEAQRHGLIAMLALPIVRRDEQSCRGKALQENRGPLYGPVASSTIGAIERSKGRGPLNGVAMHPLVTDTDNSRLRGLMATPLARHHVETMRLLAGKLNRARIVPAVRIPGSVVTMNSRVACWDETTAASQELALVYPWNVTGVGQISVLSRAGIDLLAAVPGQLVRLGDATLKIAFVSYQPEAEREFFL